jgi:hypothetical protein
VLSPATTWTGGGGGAGGSAGPGGSGVAGLLDAAAGGASIGGYSGGGSGWLAQPASRNNAIEARLLETMRKDNGMFDLKGVGM